MAKKKESKSIDELLKEALIPKEEQPYEIPSNWEWVGTNSISNVVTGNTPSKSNLFYWDTKDIAFVGPSDLDQKRNLDASENYVSNLAKEKIRLIPEKSTLICCIGSIGKVAFNNIECCTNQQINTLVPKRNIDNLYIYYLASTSFYKDMLWSNSSATTISIINKGKMEELPIPLPPLSEQTRIVTKLESMLSKIKEAKEKMLDAKESFELRRASILHKAFTGELTRQWRIENEKLIMDGAENLLKKINEEKLKKWEEECKNAESQGKKKPSKPKLKSVEEMKISDDEKPYDLPQGWEWVRLGDVGEDFKYGYTDSAKETGDCKFLRITDIQDNQVNWNTVPFCDISSEKMQNYLLKKDDIVVARTGATTGKSFIIDKDELAVFASYLIRLRLVCISSKYTWYFMNANIYWNQITEVSSGIAQPGVNATKLAELTFPLPSLPEQQEIVDRIETLLKAEEDAGDLLNMEDKIDLLEKSILSKAFRGELGTGDPSDEPALELLKRVLGE